MRGDMMDRKTEKRFRETLSNGKLLSVYFIRKKGEHIDLSWNVGVCITENRKQANKWFNHITKNNIDITGDTSLEGLIKAKNIIFDFVWKLGKNEELKIDWENEKRKRVYLKYFQKYSDVVTHNSIKTGEPLYMTMRNPDIWIVEE